MTSTQSDIDRLDRPRQPMPNHVREALHAHGLMGDYEQRPAYQRNDYLLWINTAKREATRQKRLDQMLDELKRGDVYMRMKWNARGRD